MIKSIRNDYTYNLCDVISVLTILYFLTKYKFRFDIFIYFIYIIYNQYSIVVVFFV